MLGCEVGGLLDEQIKTLLRLERPPRRLTWRRMEREAGIARELTDELERGLHLHHHLSPRRERAMFAALGFVIALAITRGITTWLH